MREPSGVIARSRSPPVMASAAVPAADMFVRVTRPAVGRTTSHTPAPTTAEATSAAAVKETVADVQIEISQEFEIAQEAITEAGSTTPSCSGTEFTLNS
jgi:hypothetical protein